MKIKVRKFKCSGGYPKFSYFVALSFEAFLCWWRGEVMLIEEDKEEILQ